LSRNGHSHSAATPAQFIFFVGIIQTMLLLVHWFLFETWARFWGMPARGFSALGIAFGFLSVSFVTASLLAWRFPQAVVRLFYTVAAVWLGLLSFGFFAACLCWLLYGATSLSGLNFDRRILAGVLFSFAFIASIYGIVNAARVRTTPVSIKLRNLPEAWRGRRAVLVSDLHLGHVRGAGFARKIVRKIQRLEPDVVFITGDVYDGTAADVARLAEPMKEVRPTLGAYFVAGNHEEFSDHTTYLKAIEASGVRILNNEKVEIDGLQVVGVHHGDAHDAQRLRSILRNAGLDRDRASILLSHAPENLAIAEEEGISLQLSGHTHGGQIFPWTMLAGRVHGRFVYGLNRLNDLMVYTTSGAGTWGPPLRVGTKSEIVMIYFE
jgi:predicted MPP superfamily phosphohydrolase